MTKKPVKPAEKSKPEVAPILGIRIQADLREFLQALADGEDRTLSNLVLHVLTKYAQERGFKRAKKG